MFFRRSQQAAICCALIFGLFPAKTVLADVFNMPTGLTSLKFSNVGDPGNVGDTVTMNTAAEDQLWISGSADTSSGYGAVAYRYAIGTYDVTVAQYVQFLNAVATSGDRYGLYNPLMGGAASGPDTSGGTATATFYYRTSNGVNWPVVCGIKRTGSAGNYSYSLSTSADVNLGSPPLPAANGNFPVNWDNWGDAARFCNWLANGQPVGPEGPGTTETGSYTLNGAMTTAQLWAVTRNAGATYWIPTENEWYKAAYYKSGGTNAGYWGYPTRSNSPPSSTLSTTGTNNASFNFTGTNPPNSWMLTPVGYFAGSPGPYGTYDQGGDLYNYTETPVQQSQDYTGEGLYIRVMRGGSYSKPTPIELASNYRAAADPAKYGHGRTFRLATWYTTAWSGGGMGGNANNWSAAGNWSGAVPAMAGGVGVAVQFGPLSGGHPANNNDLASGTQFNGITFAGGALVYDLEGNSILLGGPVANQSGNTQTIGLAMQLVAGGGAFSTATGNIAVTGPLSGSGSLLKSGTGTLTLSGSNTCSGATTIAAGVLRAGAAGALSPSSALTISGGTLDASGFAAAVNSLTIAAGGLNLGLGNTLTSGGSAALGGNLSVSGSGGAGNYPLLSYSGRSGTFAAVTLDSNYGLLYKATELDAEHKAEVGAVTVTAVSPTVITGGTTAVTFSLANSAPAASDGLNLTASIAGSGYSGSASGSLAAAASSVFSLAGGFNSASLPLGEYTGTVTVTGTNSSLGGAALNSGGTQAVTVTVVNHAAGSLAVTAGNGFLDHAGATGLSATIAVGNAAGSRSSLEVYSAPSIGQGSLSGGLAAPYYVSPGAQQTYTATFDAGTTPGAVSDTVTLASAGDNQALPGANPLGSLTVSITGNVYSGKAQWNTGSGSWSSGSWKDTPNGGPSGAPGLLGYAGDTATFGASASGGSIGVTLDCAPVLSNLVFSNSDASYSIEPGTGNPALTLTGTDAGSPAGVTVSSGTHHLGVPVVLGSNLVVSSSGCLQIGGDISDGGLDKSLTLQGGGTLVLDGTNSYGGGTLVEAGTLIVDSESALASGKDLTVGNSSAFQLLPGVDGAVPEPSTLALLAAAAIGWIARDWRRRKQTA